MYFSDARGVLQSVSEDGGLNVTASDSLVSKFQQRVGGNNTARIRFVLLKLGRLEIFTTDLITAKNFWCKPN